MPLYISYFVKNNQQPRRKRRGIKPSARIKNLSRSRLFTQMYTCFFKHLSEIENHLKVIATEIAVIIERIEKTP